MDLFFFSFFWIYILETLDKLCILSRMDDIYLLFCKKVPNCLIAFGKKTL